MTNRNSCWCLLVCAAMPSAISASEAVQAPARRPNIILIMTDDFGMKEANQLAFSGRVKIPVNVPKLVKQGMLFTNAYAAGSAAAPTMAALLTGKTPPRLRLTSSLPPRPDAVSQLLLQAKVNLQLPAGEKTLPGFLRTADYRSGFIGAWHLAGKGSLPTDHGFDHCQDGDVTAHAEKFIEKHKDHPFFLYLSHDHILDINTGDGGFVMPGYSAKIAQTLDHCVGRVAAKLDAYGLGENTVIILTSSNGGLRKGFCDEAAVRIPLVVRWTGKVKAGATVETPVISTDLTPTLLAIAGVSTQEKWDGVSLVGLLLKEKAPPPRPFYWHQPHYTNQGGRPTGAIREGSWKLVEHYENGACELYNMDLHGDMPYQQEAGKDIFLSPDLAGKEPVRVADMRGKFEKWRREVGAQENMANPKLNGKLWRKLYPPDVYPWNAKNDNAMAVEAYKAKRALLEAVLPNAKNPPADVKPGSGAVILHARDAKVHGDKLRYENPPNKDTLGFWVQKSDWAEWEFDLPAAGVFEVELLQACGKGSGGAEVEVAVKGQTLVMKVVETGHFQRFIPRTIGTMKFDAPGRYTLTVRARTKPGAAVMDLRRIVLRAAG